MQAKSVRDLEATRREAGAARDQHVNAIRAQMEEERRERESEAEREAREETERAVGEVQDEMERRLDAQEQAWNEKMNNEMNEVNGRHQSETENHERYDAWQLLYMYIHHIYTINTPLNTSKHPIHTLYTPYIHPIYTLGGKKP